MPLPRLRSWLRAVFRRPDLNREIREELESLADQHADDLRGRGLPPAEAHRRARAAIGSLDARTQDCREQLGLRLFDELRADVRYSLRLLRRSPVFAAVAILSLALGIGANTAIFSLVDGVLLKQLPVSDPERLYFVDNAGGKSGGANGPPYPCYQILRNGTHAFSGLAMFNAQFLRARIDGHDESVRGQYVSGNYFSVLGVPAAYGRTLTPADDVAGGAGGADGPVAVISDAFWSRRFGRDPAVLGKRVEIGDKTMTIVGVTPPGFFGLTVGAPVDVNIPVTLSGANLSTPRSWWFSVIGRLAPSAAPGNARAELDAMFQTYMRSTMGKPPAPGDYFNRIELVPAARGLDQVRRQFSTALSILMVIVALVLAIGCANVAHLLLARASARESEMRLRLAIGAGRGRLMRQLLTEGFVLSILGAAGGLIVAHWGVGLLTAMVGATREQIVFAPNFDRRVLLFTTAVAVMAGVVCSLAPALGTGRTAQLQPGSPGRATASRWQRRVSQMLVVIQITISVGLLSGAALFVRTLQNLHQVEVGFNEGHLLMLPVETPTPVAKTTPEQLAALAKAAATWTDLAERLRDLPGVASAAVTNISPFSGRDREVNLTVTGAPPWPEPERLVHLNLVTAGTFDTFGLRRVSGRVFNHSDTADSAKVAVLSQAAATAYFGHDSPLGRVIVINTQPARYEIVGVVEDARYESLRVSGGRMIYLPMAQASALIGRGLFNAMVAVRAGGDPSALVPSVRDEVHRAVAGSFVAAPRTMDELIEGSLIEERLVSLLSSVFGGLALTLAVIGLYGLLSYTVVLRAREFGVRLAIGASSGAVAWMVLRDTLAMLAVALAGGFAIVSLLGRYVQSLLFGIGPRDPTAIGAAAAVLAVTALVAAYLPARRASRINPIIALRHE